MAGGDEPCEPAEAPADVGVVDNGEEGVGSEGDAEGLRGEAEEEARQDAAAADEGWIDGVDAGRGEPVAVLAAGVHGVEAPERRHGVRPAVAPYAPTSCAKIAVRNCTQRGQAAIACCSGGQTRKLRTT